MKNIDYTQVVEDEADANAGLYIVDLMLVGDFNAQFGEKCFDDFLFQHGLRSVNDRPTCYKNPDEPSCIDFILTNSPLSFHKSNCLFTGLSDCHKN